MAKVNVNAASREELVDVAGLRPAVAEAIVKHREEHGRIAGPETLNELKGVGAATVEQLKDVLAFGAEKTKEVADKAADATGTAARAGAETAKAGAEAAKRVADKGAEVTSLVARSGAEAAQRSVGAMADSAQRAVSNLADAEKATVERSGEAAKDLGQLVVSIVNEQVQANVETFQALARARSWREAVEVQSDFVRGSLERATQGTSRYFETVSRLMVGMAQVGKEQARKAA